MPVGSRDDITREERGSRNLLKAKDAEDVAAWELGLLTSRSFILLPRFSSFDFVVFKTTNGNEREVTAFAEYRERLDTAKGKWPTLIVGKDKVDKIRAAAATAHVQSIIIVRWKDGRYWWTSLDERFPTTTKRRGKSERPADTEDEVYEIPIANFKEFGGSTV